MRVAFYAPMKSPDHPVPSGDRLMARQLVATLRAGGHRVDLASNLRSYRPEPDAAAYAELENQAQAEVARLERQWAADGPPDLWFSYHPYYKSPDLLGPGLAARRGIPYVTAETSYSARRNIGVWADMQARVLRGIGQAAVNICLTLRDRDGILAAAPAARTAMLPPFVDAGPFLAVPAGAGRDSARMLVVAMMRPGDKLASYGLLAKALDRLPGALPWSLSVVGDGPARAEVMAGFAQFGAGRIVWHGQLTTDRIVALTADSALYVWPGYGEAYGLAYLEAQAAGLPVVAQRVAGVPEAVAEGTTALLSPEGDVGAFAANIERLLSDRAARMAMGAAARQFILTGRTTDRAAARLGEILQGMGGAVA